MNGAPLDPLTRQFVDALMAAGGPPVYTLSPADARALLAGQQSVPVAKPDVVIEDATFPVGPKGAVRVRIIRPKASDGLVPVVMPAVVSWITTVRLYRPDSSVTAAAILPPALSPTTAKREPFTFRADAFSTTYLVAE